MHPKPELQYIECFCHRHWHMSGPNCISTITSRRIYKKIKAIPSLFFLGHIEVQTAQEGCPISHQSPTNHGAANTSNERIVKNQRIGVSSEPQNIKEQKPELRFEIQPIRRKLRLKTSNFSLRQRLNAVYS